MEFKSTDNIAMVYETLKNIDTAITRLQERSVEIRSVNDYLTSPSGIEKLEVDPDAVFDIIKNDLKPLKEAIQFFKDQLFQDKKD